MAAVTLALVAVVVQPLGAGSAERPAGREKPQASATERGTPPPAPPGAGGASEKRELEQKREGDEARRNSRGEKEARRASRGAYRDKSGSEAREVAKEKHRDVMLAPAWAPVRTVSGQRVKRYLGAHAALVEGSDGQQALVESTLPVQAEATSGELRPVRLDLQDRGAVLAPENPLVRVDLAKTAAGGFSLPDIGVHVVAVGSPGSSEASVVADKAFYPNVGRDTDLVLKPVPQGVMTLSQLRSAESPEELAFRFRLPAGATLRKATDPKFAAEIVRDETVLAAVSAPAAWDADQRPVPVTAAVSGQTLTLHVPHRKGDWAYPLMVDPTTRADFMFWRTNASLDFTGWVSYANPLAPQDPYGWYMLAGGNPRGLYIYGYGPQVYRPGEVALWMYNPQGDASVSRVTFNYDQNYLGGDGGMCHFQAIYSASQGRYLRTWRWLDIHPAQPPAADVHQTCFVMPPGSTFHELCVSSYCPGSDGGRDDSMAVQGLYKPATYWPAAAYGYFSYVAGAEVAITDSGAPNLGAVSMPRVDQPAVPSTPLSVKAKDSGLGLREVKIEAVGRPGWSGRKTEVLKVPGTQLECDGTRNRPCPSEFTIETTVGDLPAGTTAIRVTATDALENPSSEEWSVDTGAVDRPSDQPSISADGRDVAYRSQVSDLVSGDTNDTADVFVADRVSGESERVSVSSVGAQADGPSSEPAISPDGRFVAFRSEASNLVAGDTNAAADVFVRDLVSGETTRVSVASSGAQGNGPSSESSLSADGRYLAFRSDAPNLVSADTNGAADVFVHDRATAETDRVSLNATGGQGNGPSSEPSLSADGESVAFRADATNLVSGDTNGAADVFVRPRVVDSGGVGGGTGADNITRVSVSSAGAQTGEASSDPSISADGTHVAFTSSGALADADRNGTRDVYVRNRSTLTTELASPGTADGGNHSPAISGDANYVAFVSNSRLHSGDSNGVSDIYERELDTDSSRRLSLDDDLPEANGPSDAPTVSYDATDTAFASRASNLTGDSTGARDVFVHTWSPVIPGIPAAAPDMMSSPAAAPEPSQTSEEPGGGCAGGTSSESGTGGTASESGTRTTQSASVSAASSRDGQRCDIERIPRRPARGFTGDAGFDAQPGDVLSGGEVSFAVNARTGNLFVAAEDLQPAAASHNVTLERFYNSQDQDGPGGLGAKWEWGVGPDVSLQPNVLTLRGPSGYVVSFRRRANGTLAAPAGFDGTLTPDGDGGYTLMRTSREDRFKFDASGRITETRDMAANRFIVEHTTVGGQPRLGSVSTLEGQRASLSYNPQGRTDQVSDAGGGRRYYGYDPSGQRLTSYRAPGGGETRYGYDENGDLNRIELPDGEVASFDNLPDGRTRSFTVQLPGEDPETTTLEYGRNTTTVTGPHADRTIYEYRPGGPALKLSDRLAFSDGQVIKPNRSPLRIDAAAGDGTDGTGLRDITVQVDQQPPQVFPASCPDSPCSLTRDWELDTQPLSDGPHRVQVIATDLDNRKATHTLEIRALSAGPAAPVRRDLPDPEDEPTEEDTIAQPEDPQGYCAPDPDTANTDCNEATYESPAALSVAAEPPLEDGRRAFFPLFPTPPIPPGTPTTFHGYGLGDAVSPSAVDALQNEHFPPLRVRRVRLVVPWDIILRGIAAPEQGVNHRTMNRPPNPNLVNVRADPERLGAFETWLETTRSLGLEPLISFTRTSPQLGEHQDTGLNVRPTPKKYMRQVRRFLNRYPSIRYYTAWNEPNSKSQPTSRQQAVRATPPREADSGPRTAGQYWRQFNHECRLAKRKKKGPCLVAAGDFVDEAGLLKYYIKPYRQGAAYRKGPSVWALHPYEISRAAISSSPAKRANAPLFWRAFLDSITQTNPNAKVWLTEQGADWNGGVRPDLSVQQLQYLLGLRNMANGRVTRFYYYSLFTGEGRFDTALLNPDRTRRPIYDAYKAITNPDNLPFGP